MTPAVSVTKSPPSVPPRNGSKLEHGDSDKQQKKYFDSNIEPSDKPVKSEVKTVKLDPVEKNGDVTDKSNYRDSWKQKNDTTNNTLVFNFVNTKKDVSHIENDGLDLTNRAKKVTIVFFEKLLFMQYVHCCISYYW